VLSKLEIEKGNFVSSEVACQSYVNSAATIDNGPFGVMILLAAEPANTLAEILSLLSRCKGEGFLEISKIGSLNIVKAQESLTVSHPSTPPRSIMLVMRF
jgi:hypothetical protein